jgi:exocyst complex component 2
MVRISTQPLHLQATLEIEFMHQTVAQYVSSTSAATLTEVYTTISNAYERKPDNAHENLQVQLDGVKRTLHETRKATAINFVCFRANRSDREGMTKSRGDRDRGKVKDSETERGTAPKERSERTRERGTKERDRDREIDRDQEKLRDRRDVERDRIRDRGRETPTSF